MEKDIVERAFELAETGKFRGPYQIKEALKREGYASVEYRLMGGGLRRDLQACCRNAQGRAPEEVVAHRKS